MSNIKKETRREIDNLEDMISQVEAFLSDAPSGCLKYQNKGSNTYYYQQYKDENKNEWSRRYIKKANVSLARNLAQKQYYTAIKPVLKKNLKALRNFESKYNSEEVEKIYQSLSDERKRLIEPFKNSKEEILKKWFEEKYETNISYLENLRFETEQGDLVRSKSEVIFSYESLSNTLDIRVVKKLVEDILE